MEYKKDVRNPLDGADEIFLQRMLEENAAEKRYGEIYSNRYVRQNDHEHASCGCMRNNRAADSRRSNDGDNGSHSGCGCAGSRGRNRWPDDGENNEHSGCGYAGSRDRNGCSDDGMNNEHSGCGCGNGRVNAVREGYPLAMVYSPVQEWHELLEPEEAMVNGTLFRELVFPWYPAACRDENDCECQGGRR